MSDETPLDQVEGWPEGAVQKLKQLGITTAEQVVSKGSVPGGLSAIAGHLGISEDQARTSIDAARARLAPDVARQMGAKVNTSTMGLGALPLPPDKKKAR